ncbi:hypothetical protein J2X06_002316 [Lysobacter niastensis]|uniref:Tetratricopeptide repeat protein n=1 Tax=Lysobacter niastensis TaxID=380629 RepID=A0ABU1WCL8_9GAMM|nr:hypothetical protein [Lysobacter niastensis]MDR7135107.1 hypothetical protein [Lysobacter niastensis]
MSPVRLSQLQWLALSALLGLVFLVYWPGLTGGMVFDDFPNLVNNTPLHVSWHSGWRAWLAAMFSSPSSELQRPLAMLTFAVNHALTGLDPYWMKLTNVGIHALNTALVYGLCRRLLAALDPTSDRNPRIALWVAAAWALNPINLTAVLYIVQRMESLSHTFVFAGLWLYLVGRARLLANGRGWLPLLGGLVGGTLAGALAKESAVLLPVYALAIEWMLFDRSQRNRLHERRVLGTFGLTLVLPGLIGLAWVLPRVTGAAYAGRLFGPGQRMLTESRVVADYLHWTLAPDLRAMGLYHDNIQLSQGLFSPPSTVVSLLLLTLLVVLMLKLRRHRPLASLGIAWFLLAQLITATVIPLELMFEHRNYFASLGLCLVLGDLCLRAPNNPKGRQLGAVFAGVLLLLYAGMTAARVNDWRNPLQHSLAEATRHPQSPRATYDLARNYVVLTGYRADSPYIDKAMAALEQAMAAPGSSPLPESTALVLAARTGRALHPRWWNGVERKLRERPIGPQETGALAHLAQCQIDGACSFPRPEMEAVFAAARRDPPLADVLSVRGNYALNILGDPSAALALWVEATQHAPTVAQYRISVAKLLIAMDRGDEAAPQIEALRRLGKLGQHEDEARELDRLAAAARPPR